MGDYYEVLGVAHNVSVREIERAFQWRAKQMHPDNGGDTEQFKKLSAAYEILKDPARRADYDRSLRHQARQQREDVRSGPQGFEHLHQARQQREDATVIQLHGEHVQGPPARSVARDEAIAKAALWWGIGGLVSVVLLAAVVQTLPARAPSSSGDALANALAAFVLASGVVAAVARFRGRTRRPWKLFYGTLLAAMAVLHGAAAVGLGWDLFFLGAALLFVGLWHSPATIDRLLGLGPAPKRRAHRSGAAMARITVHTSRQTVAPARQRRQA